MTSTTMEQGDEILGYARALVEPVLRSAVGSLPARMKVVSGYHLGWWDEKGAAHDERGGKAVRPALVLAVAQAAGGDQLAAVNAAAAVELVHNFTLLHDDVMDGDTLRRHRPTAWSVFGRADAILAGDTLHALAGRVLAEDRHPAAGAAACRLATCVTELCEGQHDDCAFEGLAEVTVEQCLEMSEAKTGALIGCACALGALYAGAPEGQLAEFDQFGRDLGLAFQLIDDLLGIWGDPAVTGKPVGADLMAGKKSLPVVTALSSGTAAAARLASLYGTGNGIDRALVPEVANLVELGGGRAWAQAQAARYAAAAVRRLTNVLPDPARAGALLALTDMITRRER